MADQILVRRKSQICNGLQEGVYMNERKEFLGFNRSMLLQCILLYAGIWGGLLVSGYVFLALAGCVALFTVLAKPDYTYYSLLFLLPFSVIFKLSPESTSLFTYLMILAGVVLLLRKKTFRAAPLLLTMMFLLYALIGMGGNYTTVAKMISGILLFYVFVETVAPANFKNHVMAFALGLLGSSAIGTMKVSWPRLTAYFDDIDYVFVDGISTARFSGLNYDPNYYSIAVILAVFLCLRLFFNKDGNKLLTGLVTIALIVFGFTSYSKMFLLSILVLAVIFVLYRMKTPKQLMTTLIFTCIIAVVFYRWADSSGYLSTIMERLSDNDISTGRFDIWKTYIEYIWSSPKTLFLGDGLGAPYCITQEPHNAYIELIFFLGIFGGALFIITIANIIGLSKHLERRTFINYALLLLFFIMIATLGIVTVNDLMFYCMLLWISMNMSRNTTRQS